jgi:leucyl-tRNA synthetase
MAPVTGQPQTESPAALPPFRYTGALANEIEAKWRERWEERAVYLSPNPLGTLDEPNGELAARPKYYALDMFPYPSGAGLHVGHPLGYIGTDIYARFKRMAGFNVLHTMGYDAFGLPAERYAVDTGQHPEITTASNIATMRRQLGRLGLGHDPRRSVATTDVGYYRWTQWIFLQIYSSYYDREADRARPIAELVDALDAGTRELPAEARPADGRGWSELDPAGRRAALDKLRLAYLDDVTVNWCPALGTVLANEEVTPDGRSEMGNFPVFRRPLRQWMMRITAYSERLIADLDHLQWTDALKAMQRNWVGRSAGADVTFGIADREGELRVFTTRPDTLYGVTFAAVAPEHPLLDGPLPAAWPDDTPQSWRGGADSPAGAVAAYRERAARRSERQRQIEQEPTGVYTGVDVVHPLTGERAPIFVADYVLIQYGYGAVMGVPDGDQRDFRFARHFDVPIKVIIRPPASWFAEHGLPEDAPVEDWPETYSGHGESVNGAPDTDGLPSLQAGEIIVAKLAERGLGAERVTYKLRDWLFSRQRYWGEPFPILFDADGVAHAVPEHLLPVTLPPMEDFAPRVSDHADEAGEVEPPLARAHDWVSVELDLGDGPQRYTRETNTMPQWAGSCWYYLRYLDPENAERFVDPEIERYWMGGDGQAGGVDLYVGGVEHAVLHLLYARFWHKVLFDLGHVSTPEPFQKLFNQGYVQAAAFMDERGFYVDAAAVVERPDGFFLDGQPVKRSYGKMGKSLKNSVAPDEIIDAHGADALRLYEMFLGPLDQDRPWDTKGIVGVVRFLQRVWRAIVDEETGELRVREAPASEATRRALHHTIFAVRRDVERMQFNTAIAALMELMNALRSDVEEGLAREVAEWIVLALAPFAPHLCEELWERLGHPDSLVWAPYPEADPALAADEQVKIAVQVNGKLRAVVEVAQGTAGEALEAAARAEHRIADQLAGKTVRRVVVVPDRLVNFVVT